MKKLAILAALLAVPGCAKNRKMQAGDTFQQTLTDTATNVRVDAWETNRRALTPKCPADWSVRKFTLHGGKQEGVDVIEVDNGTLRFAVCPTRGMGILWVKRGDVRLGWDSPVKETVHPRHVNLQSRGGLGWLEGFNEWMCRCGLESNGHPGTDKFINNVGDEAEMELTLHGKIANIPASKVEVLIDPAPPHRITVRGRVDERMFYGPKLELHAEVSTVPGSNTITISDRIVNRGGAPQEFQVLYHSNYGPPLLGEGSTVVAPAKQVTPFNDHAAKSVYDYAVYAAPTDNFIEQVYCLRVHAGENDRTTVMLRNKAGDRAASMSYSVKELPYLTVWKNTNSLGEGYVTGIEPGTNYPYNRRLERLAGRVPKLAPGAEWKASFDVSIHLGADEVGKVAERIAAIQAGRKPRIDADPNVPK